MLSRLLPVLVAAAAVALTLSPADARSAERPTRQTDELERQINHFVSNVVVTSVNESVERWDTPLCPLVAGLPKDQGEFILARVSEIARASHVPLGGEHCGPNFYVVVTDNPDALIKKWWPRDRNLSSTRDTTGYANAFLHTRGPVRVLYDAEFRTNTGEKLPAATSALDLAGVTLDLMSPPAAAPSSPKGDRTSAGVLPALASVIIVIDSQRTIDIDINIGQLADYVAMVGLAQLRPDADTGMVPTILRLFRQANQPPAGLTAWDQSFLHSLYTTDQGSAPHVSTIKEGMLAQIGH